MVKSISVFALFFVIVLFQYNLLCQKKIKPDNEFFGNWLREDYYNGLMEHKTPCQLIKFVDGIMSVYFDKKTRKMTVNQNFHEGGEFRYSAFSNKKLKITCVNDTFAVYIAELIKEDNRTKLVLNNSIKKVKYIKLDKKYSYPLSENAFINDLFFTGVYAVNGNTHKKIKFTSRGRVYRWGSYTHYFLSLEKTVSPNYDAIWLQKMRGNVIYKILSLHWKKKGDNIEFFNLNGDPRNAEIKDKFRDLIKIKK